MRRALIALMVVAAVALAGCAGPDADDTREDPGTGTEPGRDEARGNEGQDPEENGEPEPEGFDVEEVVTGLDQPVHVTHAGDGSGRLFIVEQPGRVRVWQDGALADTPFLDLTGRVSTGGEQGLLAIAFHPAFAENGIVLASYTDHAGASVLSRFTVDGNAVDADSEAVLLTVPQPYGNHNGGLIAFGPDGYLYMGLGDGGSGGDPENNGQDPSTLLGSILRLNVDPDAGYAVPEANPFVADAERADEVWAWGLRNPWRFSFDRGTGDLWISDAGQDNREEVNVQPASSTGGENYGWAAFEGSRRYRDDVPASEDMVFPVSEYNSTEDHCVVVGGLVYRGDAVPALAGVYVYADYCSGTLWGVSEVDGEWVTEELTRVDARVSAFAEDADGELLIVDREGRVLRVVPGSTPVPEGLQGGTGS